MSDASSDPWGRLCEQSELHVVLLLYGLVSSAFWTGMIVIVTGLARAGHTVFAFAMFSSWLAVSAPAVTAQLCTFFRWLTTFRASQVRTTRSAVDIGEAPGATLLTRLVGGIVSATSPFAAWSAVALYDRETMGRPFAVIAAETKRDIAALTTAVGRF